MTRKKGETKESKPKKESNRKRSKRRREEEEAKVLQSPSPEKDQVELEDNGGDCIVEEVRIGDEVFPPMEGETIPGTEIEVKERPKRARRKKFKCEHCKDTQVVEDRGGINRMSCPHCYQKSE